MMSVTELIRGFENLIWGLCILYQYFAMLVGTIYLCWKIGKWGFEKRK